MTTQLLLENTILNLCHPDLILYL